jgi:hypothetical protein
MDIEKYYVEIRKQFEDDRDSIDYINGYYCGWRMLYEDFEFYNDFSEHIKAGYVDAKADKQRQMGWVDE